MEFVVFILCIAMLITFGTLVWIMYKFSDIDSNIDRHNSKISNHWDNIYRIERQLEKTITKDHFNDTLGIIDGNFECLDKYFMGFALGHPVKKDKKK